MSSARPVERRPTRRRRSTGSIALVTFSGFLLSANPLTAQVSRFELLPRGGPVDTEVLVYVDDLPASTPVLVGFGGVGSPHEILASTMTDAQGLMTVTVRVPAWVEPGRAYLFYLAYSDQRPVFFSDPFLATDADGLARVEGRITDEGATCVVMRGANDELYSLTGTGVQDLRPGVRVVVVATIAEMSMCMQGLTLSVLEVIAAGAF